jgi:hypothetical protein
MRWRSNFTLPARCQVRSSLWIDGRVRLCQSVITLICVCQSEKRTDGWHVIGLTRWQRDGASGYRQPSNGPTDSNQLIDQWQPKSRPSNSALDKGKISDCNIYLLSRRFLFSNLWIFSMKCDINAIFRGTCHQVNERKITRTWRPRDENGLWRSEEISISCQSLYLQEERNPIRFRWQVQATWSHSIVFKIEARVQETIGRFSKLIMAS